MKNLIPWKWGLGLAVVLPLAGWCLQQASSSPKTNVAVVTPEPLSEPAATVAPADAPAPAETAPEADPADAAVRPITAEKPLPPDIKLTAAAADVIKLADSGVEQSILLAYITNSTSTFNLGSDEIIYLNDLGIPSTVVTAMIEHDQVLKEALTAQAAAAAVPNQPDSASLPAPGEPPPSAPEPPAVEAPLIPSYDTGYYPPPQPAAATYSTLYDSLAPMSRAMANAGIRRSWSPTPNGSRTSIAAAGSIPIAAGTGFPIIPGAGRRSIMAGGSGTIGWAGAGGPTRSGAPPGFAGVIPAIIAGGRRCRRGPGSVLESGLPIAADASVQASVLVWGGTASISSPRVMCATTTCATTR
ncbi:MAG: hypothetical protein DME25_14480 [Verrucomicrobia bacterium]|nr:MAG: hypothetical protein DME25_14480 [Verrucomicrobiota bacterium]